MKMLDLIKAGEEVWEEGNVISDILVKLNLQALKHYTEEFNKELYTLRGLYDNPIATKQHLDKLIKENNEELRKRGLSQKPLLEIVQEDVCLDGSNQLSLF